MQPFVLAVELGASGASRYQVQNFMPSLHLPSSNSEQQARPTQRLHLHTCGSSLASLADAGSEYELAKS